MDYEVGKSSLQPKHNQTGQDRQASYMRPLEKMINGFDPVKIDQVGINLQSKVQLKLLSNLTLTLKRSESRNMIAGAKQFLVHNHKP